MTDYCTDLDLSGRLAVPERCPSCSSATLVPVDNGSLINFVCASCADCFRIEMGRVSPVDPRACPSCTHRPPCQDLAAARRGGYADAGRAGT